MLQILSANQEGCCLLRALKKAVKDVVGQSTADQTDIIIAQIWYSQGHNTGPLSVSLVRFFGGGSLRQVMNKKVIMCCVPPAVL